MSNDQALTLLQGQQLAIPASIQALMEQTTQDDLQTNVGASFAVLSIKGKVFQVKFGGHSTPILVEMNGQKYAAPYFDVVIPKARGELSKTYYPGGYTDGDDAPPQCWSEDGVNPLAPLEQRPLAPMQNGQHCTDCRLCPMNVFGSKMTDDGRKAKACGDTRKLVLLPIDPATNQMDADNVKFGGPMLLRIPAASLKPFAEYGAKLQGMGLAYYGVVTRLEFDPTQSYPKFVLKAVRTLTEAEGMDMIRVRDSAQVRQILEGSHTTSAPAAALAPPAAAPVQAMPQPAPATAAPVAAPAPLQAAPAVHTPPPVQQAPVYAQVPVQQAPVQAAPIQQAPAPLPPPPAAPPAPVQVAPVLEVLNGRTRRDWEVAGWLDDQQLVDAGHARWVQPAGLPPPPAATTLPPPPAIVSAGVAAAPAPAVAPVQITEQLLSKVDGLLSS